MSLSKRIGGLAVGFLLAVAGATAAAAQDAYTTADLNVRAGPGTDYEIIDSLPEGTGVDTLNCSGSWCRIRGPGGLGGWVSANYLDESGASAPAPPPVVVTPPPIYVPPPVYAPGPIYRPRPPQWRPGWDRPRPRPPGWGDRPPGTRPPGWTPGPGWGGRPPGTRPPGTRPPGWTPGPGGGRPPGGWNPGGGRPPGVGPRPGRPGGPGAGRPTGPRGGWNPGPGHPVITPAPAGPGGQ